MLRRRFRRSTGFRILFPPVGAGFSLRWPQAEAGAYGKLLPAGHLNSWRDWAVHYGRGSVGVESFHGGVDTTAAPGGWWSQAGGVQFRRARLAVFMARVPSPAG